MLLSWGWVTQASTRTVSWLARLSSVTVCSTRLDTSWNTVGCWLEVTRLPSSCSVTLGTMEKYYLPVRGARSLLTC